MVRDRSAESGALGSQFTAGYSEGYLYSVHAGGTEVVCYDIGSGKEIWRDSIDLRTPV